MDPGSSFLRTCTSPRALSKRSTPGFSIAHGCSCSPWAGRAVGEANGAGHDTLRLPGLARRGEAERATGVGERQGGEAACHSDVKCFVCFTSRKLLVNEVQD